MIVGLTGGIATGKSTVSNRLRELGQVVVDSDQIARDVVEPGRPAYEQIVAHFGQDILMADGKLNRTALGSIVFSSPEQRKVLESITHPAIFAEMDRQIEEAIRAGRTLIFLDVPLLIETGLHNKVDKVMLVYTSPEIQLHRLMQRDGLTKEEAQKRINAQMSIEEKRAYADIIINNNGSLKELEDQVDRILLQLQSGDI